MTRHDQWRRQKRFRKRQQFYRGMQRTLAFGHSRGDEHRSDLTPPTTSPYSTTDIN